MVDPKKTVYLKRGYEVEKNFPSQSLVPAIENEELMGSDQISSDGKKWIRLDKHPQLAHLFGSDPKVKKAAEKSLANGLNILDPRKKILIFLSIVLVILLVTLKPIKVVSDDVNDGILALQKKDYQTAQKILFPIAKNGNFEAQYGLGLMYKGGKGVPKNYKEAIRWYRLAAEQGYPPAQYNLGWMYHHGKSFQNFNEAVRWYRLTAEDGHSKAQCNLGTMYKEGKGVTKDNILAYMWWELSANQGNKLSLRKRNELENEMTLEQIAQAKKRAKEWKEKRKAWRSELRHLWRWLMTSWQLNI